MTGFATYPSLRGKVALVTGGAAGIGGEIVRQLIEQGAEVAFLDLDAGDSSPGDARFIRCDVRDIAALQVAVQQVAEELGTIDILLNNAARDDRIRFDEVDVAWWDEQIGVNVRTTSSRPKPSRRSCAVPAVARSSTWDRSARTSTCATSRDTSPPRRASRASREPSPASWGATVSG
jgi:NAD(P)-dependent dehydrogenase (short-subunit alcohol dehydrogenase family)